MIAQLSDYRALFHPITVSVLSSAGVRHGVLCVFYLPDENHLTRMTRNILYGKEFSVISSEFSPDSGSSVMIQLSGCSQWPSSDQLTTSEQFGLWGNL